MARKKELDDRKVMQDIYNAAVDLIAQNGYDGVSVRKVCAAAGISTGVFYQFYPSKAALMNRLIDHMENYYKDEVVPQLTGSGTEKMYTLMYAHVKRTCRRGRDYTKKTVESLMKRPMDKEFFNSLYVSQLYMQTAREAMEKGEITDEYSPEELLYMMESTAYGCFLLYTILGGEIDALENADRTIRAFIDGLKKR